MSGVCSRVALTDSRQISLSVPPCRYISLFSSTSLLYWNSSSFNQILPTPSSGHPGTPHTHVIERLRNGGGVRPWTAEDYCIPRLSSKTESCFLKIQRSSLTSTDVCVFVTRRTWAVPTPYCKRSSTRAAPLSTPLERFL